MIMILVFGSLNADFFLSVKNFPAPGETILTPAAEINPGGKGANQAAAAAKAGGKVKMIGCVGADDIAQVPLTALKSVGVDCSDMQVSRDLATGMAMIMVDAYGENSIVVASGSNGILSADSVSDELLTTETILVMQMEVPPEENFKLLRRAKAKGCRTILNVAPAHPVPFDILPLVDYLILNEIEAKMIYGSLFEKEEKYIKEIALAISEKTGCICLVTCGKQGVVVVREGVVSLVGALPITPVDTTGAGDAFVGIFAAQLDAGLHIGPAVAKASAGAGLACLKFGAQGALPTDEEIMARVSEIKHT